jgi:hypothetical protein
MNRKPVIGRATVLGLVIALGNCFAAGTEAPIDEYQVKAAFVYNFAKFVEWPAGTFQGPTEPIAICVLGQDPFGRSLEDTVAGRMVVGRTLVVRHISNVKQIVHCHILFIGSSENKLLLPALAGVKASGTLTIGESDAPGPDGTVIIFRLQNGKVRFDINVDAAESEKLRISSRLLSLARVAASDRK